MRKFQIVVMVDGVKLTYGITSNPRWVAASARGDERAYLLSPPIPIDEAYGLMKNLPSRLPLMGRVARWLRRSASVHSLGLKSFPMYPLDLNLSLEQQLDHKLRAKIHTLLEGRILLEHQVVKFLRHQGEWPEDIFRHLDAEFLKGEIMWVPGVTYSKWGGYRCSRCNGTNIRLEPCPHCHRNACSLCLDCLSLGEMRGCEALVYAPPKDGELQKREVPFQLDYQLTAAQRRASSKLLEFLRGSKGQALVWAACGAGKTEVAFAAIRSELSHGQRVLFAIPRRDVVVEIAGRLRKSFPQTNLAVHYGGQPWHSDGDLVVATTHQTLRFFQRFSLVILDEADAYPYQGSSMLRFALRRALAPRGKFVEMTATPAKVGKGAEIISIPARHHGYPVPEPEFCRLRLPYWNVSKQTALPGRLRKIFLGAQGQWIVFVPVVAAAKWWASILRSELDKTVDFCHSQDKNRRQKLESFYERETDLLVATSIVERGITVPGVQVVVFYADHPVFDWRALVQMAGRVGRKQESPSGLALFVARRCTVSIRKAIAQVRQVNKEARDLGLLREPDDATA